MEKNNVKKIQKLSHTGIVNNYYLNSEIIKKISTALAMQKTLLLQDFLNIIEFKKISLEFNKSKNFKEQNILLYSYNQKKSVFLDNFSKNLIKELSDNKFFTSIFNKNLKNSKIFIDTKFIELTKGDYLLINEFNSEKYLLIIDLNVAWDPNVGGLVVITNNDGSYRKIPPNKNGAILIKQQPFYIQYVNHKAKSKRQLLIISLN